MIEHDAKLFAVAAHEAVGQRRKFTELPYYIHVVEVGDMLKELQLSPEVVAAGYLHDVVEDTNVELSMISRYFGDVVAMHVDGVTERRYSNETRAQRKERTRNKFKTHSYITIRCIKLADMISNTRPLPVYAKDKKYTKWRNLYLQQQVDLLDTMTTYDPIDFIYAPSHYREAYDDLLYMMKKTIDNQLSISV